MKSLNNFQTIAHSGFVGIVGRPNVGKSTLINRLAERKLAIVSKRPQTTRHEIRAIINKNDCQIILIDIPGFHKPKDGLGHRLNQKVKKTMVEVDVVLFLVDAYAEIGAGDKYMASELARVKTPVVLGLNKIDMIGEEKLLEQKKQGESLTPLAGTVELSGLEGTGVEELLDVMTALLPEGPRYYPEGVATDQPERVLMGEIIREKIINATRDELPYAVAVEVYEVKQRRGRELVDLFARVHVERESQKGIVIGHRGRVLAQVGREAREEIERLLGSQVYLDLIVKVTKDWRRKERKVEELGY